MTNISESTQPYWPLAYSLIMRHAGENSGLSKCKLRSKARPTTDAAIATPAVETEIFDVVMAAAARCFFSKVLDGVGAEPDAKYRALDPELRDALTVGRPIAGP